MSLSRYAILGLSVALAVAILVAALVILGGPKSGPVIHAATPEATGAASSGPVVKKVRIALILIGVILVLWFGLRSVRSFVRLQPGVGFNADVGFDTTYDAIDRVPYFSWIGMDHRELLILKRTN